MNITITFEGNQEHLDLIRAAVRDGSKAWNDWRQKNPAVSPDLRGMDLAEVSLAGADLSMANLFRANLQDADLRGAKLSRASLVYAQLQGADLHNAEMMYANLEEAQFAGAQLPGAILRHSDSPQRTSKTPICVVPIWVASRAKT
jgi:uncharacterized protein YjbI with pentapeptide repeats